jgi:hypothetical protein
VSKVMNIQFQLKLGVSSPAEREYTSEGRHCAVRPIFLAILQNRISHTHTMQLPVGMQQGSK